MLLLNYFFDMSYSTKEVTTMNIHRQYLIAGASKMKAGALIYCISVTLMVDFYKKKKKKSFTDQLSKKDSFVFRQKASESN